VPSEIRAALRVAPGDEIVFRRIHDGTIVVEAAGIDFRSLAGVLDPKKRGATIRDIEEAIRKGRAGR
jgi:bifunctional DNA-binding transcriptional regulator/antitoxin component of YhaV-PrlF toxin-antitoxin module